MLEPYLKKVRSGEDLSLSDASEALRTVLREGCADEEIKSLLVALSDKGESVDEITGFALVMRELVVPIRTQYEVFVDTAGTGGGTSTFNVSTAAAFVIAGAGIPVAKHGNRAITSKSGSADVLTELGLNLDRPVSTSERALNEIGICFMFAPHFHPAMKRVASIRKEIGRRTIFNMLGPLTNPASAPFQVIGVYSEDLTGKIAEALNSLGSKRAWVVHSEDGLDELSIAAETKVSEVRDGKVESFYFKPISKGVGIPKGGTPAENAALISGLLEGRVSGPPRQIVVLNAAAAIHIADEISFSDALERAERSVRTGEALRKLKELVDFYGADE